MDWITGIFYILNALAILFALLLFKWPFRETLIASLVFSSMAFLYACAWTWLLKDGLKPGFVPSEGMEALRRFGSQIIFPLSIYVAIVLAAAGIFLSRRKTAK